MPEIQKALYDIQGNKINQETSAAAVYVSDTSNYFPETDSEGVMKNLGARTHFPATNLVTNGNFANGTTGWTPSDSTGSVSNNVYSSTGNGTTNYPRFSQSFTQFIGKTNKFYITAFARVTSTFCQTLRFFTWNGSVLGYPTTPISSPVQNQWYNMSAIIPNTSSSAWSIGIQHTYADATTANGKVMEVQYVSAIDLTATFGAGNEPTVAEMDAIIAEYPNSWFDGTVNPLLTPKQMLDLIRAKANIVQENWITPTLLNGWVNPSAGTYHTLSYRKDSFGIVHFRGVISGGATGLLFVLPSGYRPSRAIRFAVPTGATTFTSVLVDNSWLTGTNGAVVLPNNQTGTIDLTGIKFFAEA